jgi:hypothetical protein
MLGQQLTGNSNLPPDKRTKLQTGLGLFRRQLRDHRKRVATPSDNADRRASSPNSAIAVCKFGGHQVTLPPLAPGELSLMGSGTKLRKFPEHPAMGAGQASKPVKPSEFCSGTALGRFAFAGGA